MRKKHKPQNVKCRTAKFKSKAARQLFRFYILHFTFYIFLLPSCYEPVEGCLDIRARDFEVDADEPCDGCCDYPVVKLNFLHRVADQDTFFNLVYLDSVYHDGAQNPFWLKSVQFFISNLRVIDENGIAIGVSEKLEISIPLPDGEIELDSVEDNFALIDPGNFRAATLGTFSNPGKYNKIRFTLGIDNPSNKADPDALPENHPLTTPDMYRSVDSSFVFNRIELCWETMTADTIPILIEVGGEGQTREVELDFAETFLLDNGFNLSITLRIDYLSWFNTINLEEDSGEILAAKIVDQLAESFSLIAVEPD